MAMTLRGGTLTAGASLTVYEVRDDATGTKRWSRWDRPPLTMAAGGAFTTAPITVERRPYVLQAKQTVGSQTSGLSEKLAVNVTDPAAQAPPIGVWLAGAGRLGVDRRHGCAVRDRERERQGGGRSGAARVRSVSADALGNWSDVFTMPPGSWEITITQTTSDHTSEPAKTVTVEVPAPPLNVWAPVKNQAVSCPTRTCLVSFSGSGANTTWGRIFVADGDARFLVDLPTVPAQVMPDGAGNFTGQVALDHGKHLLKIFQRTNGAESGTELDHGAGPPGGRLDRHRLARQWPGDRFGGDRLGVRTAAARSAGQGHRVPGAAQQGGHLRRAGDSQQDARQFWPRDRWTSTTAGSSCRCMSTATACNAWA